MNKGFTEALEKRKSSTVLGKWCHARLVIGGKPSDTIEVPIKVKRNSSKYERDTALAYELTTFDKFELAALILMYCKELGTSFPIDIVFKSVITGQDSVGTAPSMDEVVITKDALTIIKADKANLKAFKGTKDPIGKYLLKLRRESKL
jgi:hypothetical protein